MAWNGSGSAATSAAMNKKAAKPKKSTAANSAPASGAFKGIIALLVLAILGGLAYVYLTNEEVREKVKEKLPKKQITEVEADIAEPVAEEPIVEPVKESVTRRYEDGVEVISFTSRTNNTGVIVETLQLANGKSKRKVHVPKPVFPNAADQVIDIALSCPIGQSMPPLPGLDNIDEDFVNSLLSPIVIKEEDSQEIKKRKLAVIEAKSFISREIKNGKSVAQCLNEYRNQMERIADSHLLLTQQLQEMKAEGASGSDIEEYRNVANKLFQEQGIPEM